MFVLGDAKKKYVHLYLIWQAVRNYHYDNDPVLAECGISIEKQLTPVEGRVLETPKVKIHLVCVREREIKRQCRGVIFLDLSL